MASQPPAHSDQLKLSFPAEHVLLLAFNRPDALNALTPQMAHDIKRILTWFDDEPDLWVVVVTGTGRAFCAGADLKAWHRDQQRGTASEQEGVASSVHGFGAISRRHISPKPMIAAVNGGAYGGGVEIILNCDLVVASEDAKLALPEVKRGVTAAQGVIPRLSKVAGHQFASELLLLGKTISASEAHARFGFVNFVVPAAEVVSTAIGLAKQMTQNSPDSVQSTKRALILSNQHGSFEATVRAHTWSPEAKRTYKGQNIKEGLKAFTEKRAPVWRNPAKL